MNSDHFRLLCGHFATGVTVLTVLDEKELPHGMTASSFASVSLEPPLISVAVDHAATAYAALRASKRFTINILTSQQELLARRFAEGLDERFDGVGWQRDADDHIVLDDALAHICCDVWTIVEAGDHTIFIGQVTSGSVRDGARPLLHYRGGYQW